MADERKVFTAYVTRNFREVLYDKKVLLYKVEHENGKLFRDHMWIKVSKRIEKFIPETNDSKTKIKFTGVIVNYISSEGTKQKVDKIRSIEEIE
jgi:hypothetical protein